MRERGRQCKEDEDGHGTRVTGGDEEEDDDDDDLDVDDGDDEEYGQNEEDNVKRVMMRMSKFVMMRQCEENMIIMMNGDCDFDGEDDREE